MTNNAESVNAIGMFAERVGVPVFLCLIFSGFMIWDLVQRTNTSEADKAFQREQTATVMEVITKHSIVMAEVSQTIDGNTKAVEGMQAAIKSLESEIRRQHP